MTEWDVEKLLARSQLGLSILILGGYILLLGLAALKLTDIQYAKEMTPLASLVGFYWFQRQRPQTATDNNGHSQEKT